MMTKTAQEITDGIKDYATKKRDFLMTARALEIANEDYDIKGYLARRGWTITEGYQSRYHDGELLIAKYEGSELDFGVVNNSVDDLDEMENLKIYEPVIDK